MPDMKIFAGNATPELAKKIADRLYINLGQAKVGSFSDGEICVEITENVRGADVFIIQSTCAPTNNNLMELIVMIHALRRASAGRITAVIPYRFSCRFLLPPRTAARLSNGCSEHGSASAFARWRWMVVRAGVAGRCATQHTGIAPPRHH